MQKIKKRVWRLLAQTHNTNVRHLTCDVDHQLDNKMLKFIHMCINHHNKVCRSLLHVLHEMQSMELKNNNKDTY